MSKVLVREWDDMAAEYGVYEATGSIYGPEDVFTSAMKEYCGKPKEDLEWSKWNAKPWMFTDW